VNAKDRLGATSLHYLARVHGQDSLNLFQRLVVEKGANFMLIDKEMNSVIHYAIKYKNVSWFVYYFIGRNCEVFD
jgi:hypothetical protein